MLVPLDAAPQGEDELALEFYNEFKERAIAKHCLAEGGELLDLGLVFANFVDAFYQVHARKFTGRDISILKLDVDVESKLRKLGFDTVDKVLETGPDEIFEKRGFGETSYKKLLKRLGELHLAHN